MSLEANGSEFFFNRQPRLDRACDVCRRRKIKCIRTDGDRRRCAHCETFDLDCTFDMPNSRRGPSSSTSYVLQLEARIKRMESVLIKLSKDGSLAQSGDNRPLESPPSRTPDHPTLPPATLPPPTIESDEDAYTSNSDDDCAIENGGVPSWIAKNDEDGGPGGYQGKSSHVHLVRSAFEFRDDYISTQMGTRYVQSKPFPPRRPNTWKLYPTELKDTRRIFNLLAEHQYNFPNSDLLDELVDKYFRHINDFLPLLNEVLFKGQVKGGDHLTNQGFGAVLLVVLALGAKFSDDPRVCMDPSQPQSAGWQWFTQVQHMQHLFVVPATLFDIQIIVLSVTFLHGSSTPEAGWSILGAAIRLAADVGVHRKRSYGSKPTPYTELWKRAFWALVCIDRFVSSNLGRPLAIREEDFDLELPIECDDEYWFVSDPELAFKQPPGKPSTMSFFIHMIKSLHIMSFVTRTIYSINKSKVFLGLVGPKWEERIVSQCDSAINEWRANIPKHLRWDPLRTDNCLFHQSAMLETYYFQMQIVIHRPFIRCGGTKRSPVSFPSLEICANAARSLSSLLGIQYDRPAGSPPWQMLAAFIAGVTLLFHAEGIKQHNLTADPSSEMEGVQKCIGVLEMLEKAWHVAGRYRDTLYELAASKGLPLPLAPRAASADLRRSNTSHFPPEVSSSLRVVAREELFNPGTTEEAASISLSSLDLTTTQILPTSSTGDSSSQTQIPVVPSTISASLTQPLLELNPSLSFPPSTHDTSLTAQLQWHTYAMPPAQYPPTVSGNEFSYHPWTPYEDVNAILAAEHDPTSLWATAPAAFDLDAWNSYINSMTNPFLQN